MLGLFKIPKVIKIQPNDIFPIIGSLIGDFRFLVVTLALFGFGHHDQDGWRGDLIHQRSGLGEHFYLDVDAGSFFNETAFLVEFGCFLPLLHLLTNRRDIDDDVLVVYILCNTKTSLNISHLDGCSCDASIALGVVLLMVDIDSVNIILSFV